MAYDEDLAERVREFAQSEPGWSEKRMFGGLATLIDGKLAVAVSTHGGLLVNVPAAEAEAALEEPGAELAIMGGREMRGWVRVDESVCADDAALERWVGRGVAAARNRKKS
ncbi:MAG: RNA methyltransferase [Hamadaea sp.]|uniref:TfoX/Sxy family protein n=1 Tax=Hamadaea sp. TaxID=2024425 RepID=UPI0017F6F117|nr:TfoX/Sxy family protein [Hamadaea sp.]NUT18738.1 RNA methyltransferase [Hamadaea sp.]